MERIMEMAVTLKKGRDKQKAVHVHSRQEIPIVMSPWVKSTVPFYFSAGKLEKASSHIKWQRSES